MTDHRRAYPAPLQSVDCELRFPGSPAVDLARAELFERLRDRFPVLHVPFAEAGVAPALQPYRFTDTINSKWVGLAVNRFGFGCQGHHYSSFDTFKTEFLELLATFSDVFPGIRDTGLTRIGLRYINHLPVVRGADGQISEVPLELPVVGSPGGYVQNVLSVLERQVSDGLLRTIVDTTQEELAPNLALLDFDFMYNAASESPIPYDEVENRLVDAHTVTKRILSQILSEAYALEAGIA
jgi:uncharacterized protein (TIGR04255 family)